MSDPPHPTAAVSAHFSRRWRFSLVWVIPIVTAAIGGWLAWDTLSQRGPLITVTFESAEGIQAGQSHVRHKDVDMGQVQRIALTRDLQHVVMTIRMNREAEPLLTDKARFWVVKPRIFAGAVSGLETLLSGSYIELLPSAAGGERKRDFVGLENPPVLQSDVPGRTFLLQAPRIGNISLGSPVYYRDLSVGEVLGWNVSDMADSVTVHTFVREPYDRYVHEGSRFWNASGISLKLGAGGVQLHIELLRALVLGGIAFDTPAQERNSAIAGNEHIFPLFTNQEAADAASYTRHIPCVAYFRGSVSGLTADALVTLHGIRVGKVSSVGLRYDPQLDAVIVPVYFDIEPQRIAEMPMPAEQSLQAAMQTLVQRGMRVSLQSASLITGEKQITLVYLPKAPEAALHTEGSTFVIPTLGRGEEDPFSSAGAILAKLNAMPFEEIGENLNKTLQGTSDIANNQQLKQAIASLQGVLANVQDLVKRLNTGVDPVLQRLPAIAKELEDTMHKVNRLVGSADTGYGGNSQFNRDADRLLVQLTDTARAVRVLADLLTRHPEALIRGRAEQGP